MFLSAAPAPTAADLLAAADSERAAARLDEALKAYEAARREAARNRDEKSEAAALLGMAGVEYQQGNYDGTARHAAESLAASERLGDRATQADALKLIGNVQFEKGDPAGKATAEKVLAIREELGDRPGVAVALNNLGTAYKLVDPLMAIAYYDRSQREARETRRQSEAFRRPQQHRDELWRPRRLRARRRVRPGGAVLAEKENEDSARIAVALNGLGVVETYRGNYPAALALYERALEARPTDRL